MHAARLKESAIVVDGMLCRNKDSKHCSRPRPDTSLSNIPLGREHDHGRAHSNCDGPDPVICVGMLAFCHAAPPSPSLFGIYE